MGIDISDKNIATDIPFENKISFNKGCYAGQETVEMSTARGRPNKRLILIKSSDEIKEKENVFEADNSDKKIGLVTSVSFSEHDKSHYALCLIKNSSEAKSFKVGSADCFEV